MEKLVVALDTRAYPIYIDNEIKDLTVLSPYISGKHILIVTNTVVAPLYLERWVNLLNKFEKYEISTLVLPDGESYKNFDSLQKILNTLLEKKLSRNTTLIALGGGVIGDMVGFAASIYQRGIPFIQIPTTLLAQVDSSVGGKTAINHPLGKNMIGSFYQPKIVLIETLSLSTLPDREYVSGLAEIVKYGLIRDVTFYQWCLDNAFALKSRNAETLNYAILKSCQHKAEVVIRDEREEGERAYLNLGHTFGHAIEKCMNYQGMLHGEAVAIGMVLALEMSVALGDLSQSHLIEFKKFLLNLNLPISIPTQLKSADLVDAMKLDKKNISGKMRFVLLKSIGSACINDSIELKLVEKILLNNGVNE